MAKVYKWVKVNKFISIIGVGLIISIGAFIVLIAQFINVLDAMV